MGPYVLKTAETTEELIESCHLRHEVFFQEFQNIKIPGIDIDQFDFTFDHLIIIHKETGKIVGTYRVNCTEFPIDSYTGTEFDLAGIHQLSGPYMELGRACIKKEHRRGAMAISMLWKGIMEYMNLSGANILFGCSSVKIDKTIEAALIYKYFVDQDAVLNLNQVNPKGEFHMADFKHVYSELPSQMDSSQQEYVEKTIPSLLKYYLKFGARIVGTPAYDKEFHCVDFLTVMKKSEITKNLGRRFHLS